MGQTNISIRIDEDIKKDAETLFAELGLTLSAATNIFYRQAIRTQGIPFPLTAAEHGSQKQARKEFGEVFKAMQVQSVINNTDKTAMDDIDAIVAEIRQKTRTET